MNTKVRCLALLCAATAIGATGCGGGGSSTPTVVPTEAAVAAQPVSVDPTTPPSNGAGSTLVGVHGGQSSNGPSPTKLDAPGALRPLSPGTFPRETTYQMYAGNGSRKVLRLDFRSGRYEILDGGDSSGHSTSGSFSEDVSEPGTYVFNTARTAGAFNTARFRLAQGAVVGGFPFETRSSGMTDYGVQPFVAANDFVLSAVQLDGDYNRMGLRHLASLGLPIGQTMALRISGGGTVLELCRDETVHRLENCSTITRYALSFDASDEAWTAKSMSSSDRIAFRMARIAGRNVWLEAGMALDGTAADAVFHVAVPNSTVRTSARYIGFSSENVWCMNELGRVAWAHYFTDANGQTGDMTHWISTPPADMPAGLRRMYINALPHYVAQDGALVVSTSAATIEIALFKELLTVEPPSPPSPFNGTYRVFTTNGQEHTLSINFDAATYVMTDASGLAASGSFQADPADPGTYVFASSRVSVVYNTARFRVATDGIVGAFPFAAYGSNPVAYKTLPFVAARTFMASASALAGTYEVLPSPGNPWAMRINANGTTATQCMTLSCNTASDPVWPISAGANAGQWVLTTGSQQLRIYVAKVGARAVLLSSTTTIVPTIPPVNPPLTVPIMLFGSRQTVEGVNTTPSTATLALHTASSTSFGKATISASSYSQEHLDQSGVPYPLTLSLLTVSQLTPSVKYALDSAGSPSALTLHNEELFVMHAITGGMYVGSVDR